MPISISVFGLGYVGSVTAACLARLGHNVVGVDPVLSKVEAMAHGRTPILEAQMPELIADAHAQGRLSATCEVAPAIARSDLSFISVGTPNLRNGKLDLSHVENVCREIGNALRTKADYHWIVLRSTVLPGTTETLVVPTLEEASGKKAGRDFGVCFNPEFLREGTAVNDFFHPPFTVIGCTEGTSAELLRSIYQFAPAECFQTSARSAEMVKYACNAFHALKVAFANEIGTLCNLLEADKDVVTEIFKSDTKLNISTAYLTPGSAFGGSCLPKDLRALSYRAKELDLKLPVLENILSSNMEHLERAIEQVLCTGKRKIGVLGLSFKSGTDDLRESPMVHIIKRLLGEGCQIQVWDETVSLGQLIGSNAQFIKNTIPQIGSMLTRDRDEVVGNAEVLLLGTKIADKETVIGALRADQVVIDLLRLEHSAVRTATAYA